MARMFHDGSRSLQDRFDTRRIADRIEGTIAFPTYDGNGMYLTLGNLQRNRNVGLLFISFERGRRMRLNGVSSIDERDPLLADYPDSQSMVRVAVPHPLLSCSVYS